MVQHSFYLIYPLVLRKILPPKKSSIVSQRNMDTIAHRYCRISDIGGNLSISPCSCGEYNVDSWSLGVTVLDIPSILIPQLKKNTT